MIINLLQERDRSHLHPIQITIPQPPLVIGTDPGPIFFDTGTSLTSAGDPLESQSVTIHSPNVSDLPDAAPALATSSGSDTATGVNVVYLGTFVVHDPPLLPPGYEITNPLRVVLDPENFPNSRLFNPPLSHMTQADLNERSRRLREQLLEQISSAALELLPGDES